MKTFLVIILFIIIGLMILGSNETPKDRAERACSDNFGAFYMSREFVKSRLKAPATASFPSMTEQGVKVFNSFPCQFFVSAWVDAQNSFGANIRSKYSMDLKYDKSTNNWTATNIYISN